LLTATVDPRAAPNVVRGDVRTRLDDYKKSLARWLLDPAPFAIVLCENSAFDLTEIAGICEAHNSQRKQIELLSFRSEPETALRGKSYGEVGIVAHALEHSRLLACSSVVMKVTGRLYARNAGRLLQSVCRSSPRMVFCDLCVNLSWADSRLFCSAPDFLKDYLLPLRELLNDQLRNDRLDLEAVLARAVHLALSSGYAWSPLPVFPALEGVSGTWGTRYSSSLIERKMHELMRQIKLFIYSR
jgi:hypothetical protein